jgi:tRNA(fMet)-specific endonuclease VapC
LRYILDTDTLSYYLRGEGGVAERLLRVPRRDVALTAVTVFELWRGAGVAGFGSERRTQLRSLLDGFVHLPLGGREAERAAEVTTVLEAEGRPIGRLDTLIAGIVLTTEATLVSRNLEHFRRVEGLRVEDWYG